MRGGEAEGGAASGGLLLMNMMTGLDKLARQEAGHHPKESVKVCLLAVTVCMYLYNFGLLYVPYNIIHLENLP